MIKTQKNNLSGNINMLYKHIYMTLVIIFILSAMTTPSYAWRSGGSVIDTHDMIFQKAVDMLPAKEKSKLEMNQTVVYLGLHAPDCGIATDPYCLGDNDRSHYVYYNSNGVVTNDDSALNARDEYNKAKQYYLDGDMYNFSLHLGAMSHYIQDPGAWPHATSIEGGSMHTGYESAVNHENAELFSGTKSDVRKEMSAYDAALKNAYETTFDTLDNGAYDINWIYANCGNCSKSNFVLSSNPELFDRTKAILNYDANRLSDVLYKLVREIKPDPDPTPTGATPTPTPVPIKPSIVKYDPTVLTIEEQSPSTKTFNITTDQIVNITWSLDKKAIQKHYNIKTDSYTDTVYIIGNHNVTATAQNKNGSVSKKWNWNIIGAFGIDKDSSSVYVGKPKNVTFTITRDCGLELGDICNNITKVPVSGTKISLEGKANGSNTTNADGNAIITINATTNGTINVTASKAGYIDSQTNISSDFAPVPVYTPNPSSGGGSSGGSSSGGGGGGGSNTAEPFENIYKYEVQEMSVFTTPVAFKYKNPELAVYEVMVTSTQSDIASLRIEVLKDTSKLVDSPASGIVFKNLNAWMNYKRIKNAAIRFQIENYWIRKNELSSENIKMSKWDNSTKKWIELPTSVISKDDISTYFESSLVDISGSYAIRGIKDDTSVRVESSVNLESGVEEVEQTVAKPVDTISKNAPGFDIMLSIILIVSMVYTIRRIRR